MTLTLLREISDRGGCCYLGQPFTNFWLGHAAASYDGERAAAALMKRGIRVFCPIGHSYHIAMVGGIDQEDADFWEWADRWFVERCDALIVLKLDGWAESAGLRGEIEAFEAAGKPIVCVTMEELECF